MTRGSPLRKEPHDIASAFRSSGSGALSSAASAFPARANCGSLPLGSAHTWANLMMRPTRPIPKRSWPRCAQASTFSIPRLTTGINARNAISVRPLRNWWAAENYGATKFWCAPRRAIFRWTGICLRIRASTSPGSMSRRGFSIRRISRVACTASRRLSRQPDRTLTPESRAGDHRPLLSA